MGTRARIKRVRRMAAELVDEQKTPTGKLECVKALVAHGVIKRSQALELLEEPASAERQSERPNNLTGQ